MAATSYKGREPGRIAALDCKAPCKGWVVLYDRKIKGCLPGLPAALKETGRYILVHRPSGQWVGNLGTAKQARQFLHAAARGEDPLEILPKTLKKPKTGHGPPPQDDSLARARATSENAGITADSPADSPKQHEDFHLQFKTEVQSRLTPDRIVDIIEKMMTATRTFVVKISKTEEEVIEVPDWTAREKGVRLAAEYGEGKAKERPDTKQARRVSWDDIRVMCVQSPAARQAFRKLIADAEAAASAAKVPDCGSLITLADK